MDQNTVLAAIGLQEIVTAWQATKADLLRIQREFQELREEHEKCAKADNEKEDGRS